MDCWLLAICHVGERIFGRSWSVLVTLCRVTHVANVDDCCSNSSQQMFTRAVPCTLLYCVVYAGALFSFVALRCIALRVMQSYLIACVRACVWSGLPAVLECTVRHRVRPDAAVEANPFCRTHASALCLQ